MVVVVAGPVLVIREISNISMLGDTIYEVM